MSDVPPSIPAIASLTIVAAIRKTTTRSRDRRAGCSGIDVLDEAAERAMLTSVYTFFPRAFGLPAASSNPGEASTLT